MRPAVRFLQNLSLAAAAAILPTCVATAQQNPIVAATSAPPPVATGAFGPTVAFSPYGYNPYASPYGGGYPYQSYNPSTQQLSNNSSQPTMPGQFNLPINQGGGQGGGGQGGQGGGGGGQGGQGGGAQGAGAAGSSSPATGASYDITQNPSSPLYKRYEHNSVTDPQIRPKVLSQIGRGKGIRRGFIEEAARLRASIEGQAAGRLDVRYDFTRQMIGTHLVPPVIGEVRNVEQRDGDRVLYLTVGAYQIVRPARLVITPPNWRDYLYIETAEPQTAISALAPDTPEEQKYFDEAYDSGVQKGIEEARQTFDDNLNRLERDYSGMERYHELERQGAVSLPVVKDQRRAVRVADGGQRAFVGEQVVTLRVTPRFKAARKGAYR